MYFLTQRFRDNFRIAEVRVIFMFLSKTSQFKLQDLNHDVIASIGREDLSFRKSCELEAKVLDSMANRKCAIGYVFVGYCIVSPYS